MQRSPLLISLLLAGSSACLREVPLYCDEDKPCTDPTRPYCDLNGQYEASGFIGKTCIPDPFPDAGVVECEASTTTCEHDRYVDCGPDGLARQAEDCLLGCHPAEVRCNDVAPSNGLGPALDVSSGMPALELPAGVVIDTDLGSVTTADEEQLAVPSQLIEAADGGVAIRVFIARSFVLHDLQAIGEAGLAFVSHTDISLEGRVHVRAGALTDEACRGGSGESVAGSSGGHGGSGFGTNGGSGGRDGAAAGGASGRSVGSPELSPLRGGCEGSLIDATVRYEPLGGGAVQLVARRAIRLAAGAIDANGAGAANPSSGFIEYRGNGGASGGGILLEGPSIEIDRGSGLFANGGGGSAGCDHPEDDAAENGGAGPMSASPAPGGTCGATGSRGGTGGSRGGAATSGSIAIDGGIGGGGGGAAGRIRINTTPGGFSEIGIVSPAPSVGAVSVR